MPGPLTGIRVLDCTLAAHPLARKERAIRLIASPPVDPLFARKRG